MKPHCAACNGQNRARPDCHQSFSRIGVSKLHWECWSACNLHCAFCYRTEDEPLGFEESKTLLEVCAYSGASRFVFAGGDPSLRSDLPDLIDYATELGMSVELQSNFQVFSTEIKRRVATGSINLSGLSLDGGSVESHDSFRSTRGNFRAVLRALDYHQEHDAPVIVRTVVSKNNWRQIGPIARILSPYTVIQRWSLLEFSPIGQGYRNRVDYTLKSDLFDLACAMAHVTYEGNGEIDVFRTAAKSGTYGLITAAGRLYGVSDAVADGRYPVIGGMLSAHLADLASALPFSRHRHHVRYGG